MNIILFGPQGCGKGTQADLITRNHGLYHLSMGDELRAEIKKVTPLGKKIQEIVNSGALVPDEITNTLLMNVAKRHKHIIFDGYPRREEQLQFLTKNFKIDAAIEIDLSETESIKRIASRRMCSKCGKNYNTIYLKPKVEGKCDIDGAVLVQRNDDKPAEIKKRLNIYKDQTEPLKKYYSKQKILHIIDGNQPIADVYKDIDRILKKI
jgi:adenylate kinase